MTSHLDGDVPPVGVDDMKRIMIDKCPLGFEIANRPLLRSLHLPHRGHGTAHQDEKEATNAGVFLQILFGDLRFTLFTAAFHDGNPMCLRIDERHYVSLLVMKRLTEALLHRIIRHRQGCPKCAAGGGHPVWVLAVGFPGGKIRQISLWREQVLGVRRRLANYRKLKAVLERICELNQQELRAELGAEKKRG
jgi:hypothetical protein